MFFTITYITHWGDQCETTVEADTVALAIEHLEDIGECSYAIGDDIATEKEIAAYKASKEQVAKEEAWVD